MIGWFFANMIWASAFMLLVLAFRRPAARLFGAGPAYALWLLPALRLFMPPLPTWQTGLAASEAPKMLILFVNAAAPLPTHNGPEQWVPLLLTIWATGMAAFLIWQWLAYRHFLTSISAGARAGVHGRFPVIESAAVDGPLALGLLDRRIIVPSDFAARYTVGEQRLALEHEAVHHRRGDIWWNHLALAMLALNWFNPIAWFAFRAFRADQELACDAAVTAAAGPDVRHDYARALVKSASRPSLIAACPLHHADQLKRRLGMIRTHQRSGARMAGGTVVITLLAGVGIAVGSPSFAQSEPAQPVDGGKHSDSAVTQTDIIFVKRQKGATADNRAKTAADLEAQYESARRDGAVSASAPCPNSQDIFRVVNVDSDKKHLTQFAVCASQDADPATRLAMLEHARAQIAQNTDISVENRARTLESLDRAIERLRKQ